MRTLNQQEIKAVSGAGEFKDIVKDARDFIKDLPDIYKEAIDSATEMMCIGTNNC